MNTNRILLDGLQASMGAAVLEKLGAMAPLPSSGYVAGQAVASAISELFGDGRAVIYNDVDVFRDARGDSDGPDYDYDAAPRSERKRPALSLTQFCGNELVREYGQISLNAVKRYQVRRVSRDGMLNEVHCEFEEVTPQDFLATFDMNCVQVGVDIETKALFWTPAFDEFCRTRQLDIASMHTPFHSLIRYFRKRRELEGVYGNDERMIEMAGVAYHRGLEMKQGKLAEFADLRWRFGHVMVEKYREVASDILPHFDLVEESIDGYTVNHLRPRFDAPRDLLRQARDVNITTSLPLVSRALREKRRPAKAARLIHLLNQSVKDSACKRTWAKIEDGFVQGNVTPSQMQRLDKVCNIHAIEHVVMGRTLGESWDRLKAIEAAVATRGMWVYGALETTSLKHLDASTLSDCLDEAEVLLSQPLTTASFFPTVVAGYYVKELTTGRELLEEGQAMRHCVAGYAKAVKERHTKIFSLVKQGSRKCDGLTLQLTRNPGGPWRDVQCRGLQNRPATDVEHAVAKAVRNLVQAAQLLPSPVRQKLIKLAPRTAANVGGAVFALLDKRGRKPPKARRASQVSQWLVDRFDLPSYVFCLKGERYVSHSAHGSPWLYWTTTLGTNLQSWCRKHHLKAVASTLEGMFGVPESQGGLDFIPF